MKSKKLKKKWKAVDINEYVDSTPARKPIGSWADEVDEEDANSYEIKTERVVLPTAPRASRGTTIDESKVPSSAPFQAYLSNIPYDLTEEELIVFFHNLKVKNVRLPRDEKGGNKAKGYGYIEFEDRASLISALTSGENTLKGRPIRIELTTNVDNSNRGGGRGGRGNRDGGRSDMGSGGPDRTAGNWRSGPRSDDFEDRGGGSGGSGYDRGGYSNRRDYGGGGFSRAFEERSFFRDERDRYCRDDRLRDDHRGGFSQSGGFERGGGGGSSGGGGFSRDRDDRGFSRDRDDRGFSRDRDDKGFSNFSDRLDRGGGYNRRDEDRYSRDDRGGGGGGGGGGSGGSGQWRDDYNRMDDRKDSRGGDRYGGGNRRDDLPSVDRGSGEVKVRPKLKLLPRSNTTPAETENEPAANPSIFGGAKPVDTAAREREIEERLRRGEDAPDLRSKSGPGSSGGGSSQKDFPLEKSTEPAPPPRENAWTRKPTSAIVNNGRSSPEEVRQSGSGNLSDDEKTEPTSKSWAARSAGGAGGESRRQEPKRIEETKTSRGPQHKGGGAGGNINTEKPKGKDEKISSKHREGRKEVDDISRMPKIQESKVPSKRTFYRNRNR